MSLMMLRGGIPKVRRETVDTTGRLYKFPFPIFWLKIRTDGPLRVYFTEEDFTADANYILVPAPAAATPYGEWEGPVELEPGGSSASANAIWMKGDGGSRGVEVVGFQRRA